MDSSDTSQAPNAEANNASLKYSGYAYLLADASMFAYGMSKRDYGAVATGLCWGTGGLVTAAYGKKSPEYRLKRLTQDLGNYLQAKGYELPPESQLSRETLLSHRTFEGIERFLYDHPSQFLNGVYGAGSLFLARSGFNKGDYWQMASGLLVCTGALSGLFIKEKQPPEDQPKPTLFNNPVAYIQEKPLRLSGTMYTLNNVTLAKSGWDEMRANPADKRYLFKYLAVASFVIANNLLSKSTKDRDKQANEVPIEALEAVAAEAIAKQPKDVQDAMLEETASYLSEQDSISISKEDLLAALKEKLRESVPERPVQTAQHQGRLDESPARAMSNE